MCGVDRVLQGVSLEAEVAPAELFKVMASMLKEAEAAMSQQFAEQSLLSPDEPSESPQFTAFAHNPVGEDQGGVGSPSRERVACNLSSDKSCISTSGLSNDTVSSCPVSMPAEAAGRAAGMTTPRSEDASVDWAEVLAGPWSDSDTNTASSQLGKKGRSYIVVVMKSAVASSHIH
jgi:hypothetical protein